MADVKTFGVKVPEELHGEATELQKKLGLTGEGFLSELVRAYKSEKTREQVPAVAEDLKELQTLTSRINNIYVNLAYRYDSLDKDKDMELQEQLSKKDSIISSLQDKVNQITEKNEVLETAFNNAVEEKDTLKRQMQQLTDTLDSNKALIEEYKSKNDMLTGMLQKYEKYPEELDQYKKLLADSDIKYMELVNENKKKEIEIESLKAAAEALKERSAGEANDLKEKHSREIVRLQDQADISKERALLEKDREYQALISKINEEHNEKIRELLRENQEYNTKISKLMDENQDKTNRVNELVMQLKELQK